MDIFDKIVRKINKGCVDIGVVLLVVVILASFTQVLCRYFLHIAAAWTEELARMAFNYSCMLGAGVCIAESSNPVMSMLTDHLTNKGNKKGLLAQRLFAYAVMLFITVLLIPIGIKFMGNVSIQTSAQLGINLKYLYLSIPIGLSIVVLNIINNVLTLLKNWGKDDTGTSQEAEEGAL